MKTLSRLSGCFLVVFAFTILDTTGNYQGDSSLQSENPRDKPMQDFRSHTKHSSLRGKAEKENANLLQKRSGTPPMIQSLSAEAKLSRAEAILQAIREKGCPESKENLYNITVYTADLRLAGTTSLVYINLYGRMYGMEESTAKIRLTNNDENEFSRGGVDSFVVKAKFVGLVERVTIEHDNTGFLPDWNLHKIVVDDLALGTALTFMCDCEMAGYENQVTLPPI